MHPHVNAVAGSSSTPRKSKQPFISADNRPGQYDGVFRVVLISTGSVASVKMPDIVRALSQVSFGVGFQHEDGLHHLLLMILSEGWRCCTASRSNPTIITFLFTREHRCVCPHVSDDSGAG